MSPKHVRKNTAEYWKIKYEMAQNLIRETQAKSLALDEIPGFLKINKVKPKVTSTNARVMQVHGSIEGKDVIKLVQSIKDDKNKKQKAKEDRADKNRKKRIRFIAVKKNVFVSSPSVWHLV